MGVSEKYGVPSFGGPYNEEPTIYGYYIRVPYFSETPMWSFGNGPAKGSTIASTAQPTAASMPCQNNSVHDDGSPGNGGLNVDEKNK